MELIGAIKNYEWGKLAEQSVVAQLMLANENDKEIQQDLPYAELWMGDHISGPATLKHNNSKLSTILNTNLTYLFKVLSVRKALSIQVHPNKAEAEQLHKDRPDIYKDPNHKPEMAIALTPFTALCGFRPYKEIYEFCKELPPLENLLGGPEAVQPLTSEMPNSLRPLYAKLMMADSQAISETILEISKNFITILNKYNLQQLFNRLCNDYPGDVGVLSIFFLNIIELKPGECLYLGANEIHAYIYGDCVECMACSDNVIRAGLTPKYKDVQQLLATVNYTGLPAASKYFQPKRLHKYALLFTPPVDDFAVIQIEIPSNTTSNYDINLPSYPSILLVLEGFRILQLKGYSNIEVKRGSVIYLPAEVVSNIKIQNHPKVNDKFLAYIATKNLFPESLSY